MNCMQIELTNRCNFQCEFCATKLTRNNADLPIETVRRILDEGRNLDVCDGKIWQIAFNGLGEPLLYPDLTEAVGYAKQYYPFVGFITNGSLLNEEKSRRLLELDLDYIGVSITGVDEHIYKNFQGYGFKDLNATKKVMELVLNNVKTFLALREKMKKTTQVRIPYILIESTKKHLKVFEKYWRETGYEIMLDITPLTTWEKSRNTKYTRCERLGNDFMIFANGDVSICSCDHLRGTTLGNVYKNSLEELLGSERFERIIKANETLDLKNMPAVCLQCDRMVNFGFLKNHTDVYKTIYLNNRASNIKWKIYSVGVLFFDELKKYKYSYPVWRKVKNKIRKSETADRRQKRMTYGTEK